MHAIVLGGHGPPYGCASIIIGGHGPTYGAARAVDGANPVFRSRRRHYNPAP